MSENFRGKKLEEWIISRREKKEAIKSKRTMQKEKKGDRKGDGMHFTTVNQGSERAFNTFNKDRLTLQ